jgi:uncharacterized oxidoreductase
MRMSSNTILITGGSAGIGRGLADAFLALGNRVIIASRKDTAVPGMSHVAMDVTSAASIAAAASEAIAKFPELNCVISNAGVQRSGDFAAGGVNDAAMVEEIETNLLGPMRVCSAFIPHLSGRPAATLINVSSGLAFVPLARVPVYCASKAALHSFCVSLRHQLKTCGIRVIELIPPYVDTGLDRGRRRPDGPAPMPLDQFISGAMEGLAGGADEVPVADAKFLYGSSGTGEAFTKAFSRLNPGPVPSP